MRGDSGLCAKKVPLGKDMVRGDLIGGHCLDRSTGAKNTEDAVLPLVWTE